MTLMRLCWREVINHPRFTLLFTLNLALGICGFLALDAFKNSLSQELLDQSKKILSAEIEVSSRHPIASDEWEKARALLPRGTQITEVRSMFSMVGYGDESRLIQLKSIEDNFPLIGKIELDSPAPALSSSPSLWVYPELLQQLKMKVGDSLQLGGKPFRVTGIVKDDPQNLISAVAMAPRAYLSQKWLDETGLVRKGSTVSYARFMTFPKGTDINELRDRLFDAFVDPGIRVETHEQASQQMARLLGYLNDYLGLVSLTALMLASVGLGFLFRAYLSGRSVDMAILLSVGGTLGQVKALFLFQIFVLASFALIPSVFLGMVGIPLLTQLLGAFFPVAVEPAVSMSSIFKAFVVSVLGSLFACWPLLGLVNQFQPAQLLSENSYSGGKPKLLHWVPLLLMYWGLSIWQSQSVELGTLFIVAFLISALLAGALGWGLLKYIGRLQVRSLSLRLALRQLSRRPFASLSCFMALSLGALLVNLIPQIEASLEAEIQQPESSQLPSLFLFDIQEEQVQPLEEILRSEGLELNPPSPLIRARILSVNGEAFDKGDGREGLTREQQREHRFRNRGFNLSYRGSFSESESLYSGRLFTSPYEGEGTPEISVEHRFAERLGFDLGDVLEFDIQGVPIKGEIVNLRRVRWSSFQPNFFVQFPEGVLEPAPKTFIASIPSMESDLKLRLQNRVVQALPNISIVDVGRVVNRITSIADQMLGAVKWMAALSLFVGFMVVFSIALQQVRERRWDLNLMKILGGRFEDLQGLICWEFGLLGVMASFLGALISVALSFVLSLYLFDGVWAVNVWVPLVSPIALTVLTVLTAMLAVRGVLRESPQVILTDVA